MEGDVFRAVASLAAGASDGQTADELLDNIVATVGADAGGIRIGRPGSEVVCWRGPQVGTATAERLFAHLDAVLGTTRRACLLRPGNSVLTALDRGFESLGLLSIGSDTGPPMRLVLARRADDEPFSAIDLDVAQALCEVAAVALVATHERRRRRRFEDWLSVMEDTTTILLKGVAPRTVLEGVLDEVTRRALAVTRADMAGVAMPIERPDVLRFNVAIGEGRQILQGLSFDQDSSLSGAVYRAEEPVVLDDALADPRPNKAVIENLGVGPVACGPVWLLNRVIGVIFVGNVRDGRPLDKTQALDVVAGLDLGRPLEETTGQTLGSSDPARAALDGIDSRVVDLGRLAVLSERELALLRHLSEGLSNPEIADELGIAEKTVRNSVTSLFTKLDVDNRVQAAVYAARVQERLGRLG